MNLIPLSDETIHSLIYIFIFWNFIRFIIFLYKTFIRKRRNLIKTYGENSWALVTGATDGLGKAYCEELAKEGFNIILVSRSLEKLIKVSEEIQNLNKKIKVHVIQYDFNEKTKIEDYENTFGKLTENFDISLLVNNVGFLVSGHFAKNTLESHMRTINVNDIPQTMLTKIFCDYLSNRTNRSAVIDISSTASFFPLPYIMGIYAATKSFNYFLSRALAEEFENFNIDFLVVRLNLAESNLSKAKANLIVVTARESVTGALNDLGYEKETNGHWKHKIQAFLLKLIPVSFTFPIARILNKMKGYLKRYFGKKEKLNVN